jgi:predicted nuclease of restriction endonuclease-like RecB superfamily
MGSVLSVIIELTVVILLGVTVTYCIILDRKLQRLRSDETSIRKTVVDLGLATDRAERAIDSLKASLAESETTLAEKLRSAEAASRELDETIRSGDEVLDRIGKVVTSARRAVDQMQFRPAPPPSAPPPAPRVADTLAAAEAFAERARRRILDNAA